MCPIVCCEGSCSLLQCSTFAFLVFICAQHLHQAHIHAIQRTAKLKNSQETQHVGTQSERHLCHIDARTIVTAHAFTHTRAAYSNELQSQFHALRHTKHVQTCTYTRGILPPRLHIVCIATTMLIAQQTKQCHLLAHEWDDWRTGHDERAAARSLSQY